MPGGASAILAHTFDTDSERPMTDAQFADWMKSRVADITRDSYGDIQHLYLKCDAMLVWTNAVLDSWEAARSSRVIINKGGERAATPTEFSVLQPAQVDP
ncbi:hypothetical protein [Rhizobium ruizarguesonis]|uniref:hypothetical protein n=1 Tax=Rhizobium ruizarguesonis TaxID=2081791 RepID=UPI0010309672|nr:hypothetical protein [Rhizobium ruizarguesonis]TAW08516.1 hypothetical protein ELI26_02330 [Rhizobium ruizarguesonis]